MKRIIILFILLNSYGTLLGQNYIQVVSSNVNIRFSPSQSSTIITQANKGNIFEVAEEKGNWFGIIMFSGEYRYIHNSLCRKINHTPALPGDEQLRKSLFKALFNAEGKAMAEADRRYPPNLSDDNIYKNIDYNRILNDRYKLQVFKKFNLQPTIYSKIILEGGQKRWDL